MSDTVKRIESQINKQPNTLSDETFVEINRVPDTGVWIGVKCDVDGAELYKWGMSLKKIHGTHGCGKVGEFLVRCSLVLDTAGVNDITHSSRLHEIERRAVEEIEASRAKANNAASVMLAHLYCDSVAESKAKMLLDATRKRIEAEMEDEDGEGSKGEKDGEEGVIDHYKYLTGDEVRALEAELAYGMERFGIDVMGKLGLTGWASGKTRKGGRTGRSDNAGVNRRDKVAGVDTEAAVVERFKGAVIQKKENVGKSLRKENPKKRRGTKLIKSVAERQSEIDERGVKRVVERASDNLISTVERGHPATSAPLTKLRDASYGQSCEGWIGVKLREMGFTMTQISKMMEMDKSSIWRHVSGWTRHWKAQRLKGITFTPEKEWEIKLDNLVASTVGRFRARKGTRSVGDGSERYGTDTEDIS